MELVRPTLEHAESFLSARDRGFSFDMNPDPEAIAQLTAEIRRDAAAYVASLNDRDPIGRTVTLADGSQAPRLPQETRWMWDGEFAGSISFRWQPGTDTLPDHVLGHIGYAVVEWRRGLGYAKQALYDILDLPRAEGMRQVELTTNVDNIASQRVILANGGVFVGTRNRPMSQGGEPLHYYVIAL